MALALGLVLQLALTVGTALAGVFHLMARPKPLLEIACSSLFGPVLAESPELCSACFAGKVVLMLGLDQLWREFLVPRLVPSLS